MVYSVERKERAVRGSSSNSSHYDVGEEEDGGSGFVMERSKPPLHNFNLPVLKWGNQRHLRCMKGADSTTAAENGGAAGAGGRYGDGGFSIVAGEGGDRRRKKRSPPPSSRFVGGAGKYDVRRFRPPRFGGCGGEDGIEAVREKLMLDLKEQADKMKNQILRRNQVSDEDDDSDEEEEGDETEGGKNQERKLQSRPRSQSPIPAPPVAAAPAPAADKSQEEARPWNLRTRRAACKAPTLLGGGNSAAATTKLRIEEKKGSSSNNNNNSSPMRSDGAKSPRLRGEKRDREEKEKERPKFSVALSKKEIEDDFMQILGHRPARRPKKRPRAVQRQLDTLFPGLWLTEVTADAYKVPEIPETGKR